MTLQSEKNVLIYKKKFGACHGEEHTSLSLESICLGN